MDPIALYFEGFFPFTRSVHLFCAVYQRSGVERSLVSYTELVTLKQNYIFWSTRINSPSSHNVLYILEIRESPTTADFPPTHPRVADDNVYPLIGTGEFHLSSLLMPTYSSIDGLPFKEVILHFLPPFLSLASEGTLRIRGDVITPPQEFLKFGLRTANLPKRKSYFFGSLVTFNPRPFVAISKTNSMTESQTRQHEYIWQNHPPRKGYTTYAFGPIGKHDLSMEILKDDNPSQLIRFEVFDNDFNASIGYTDISLNELKLNIMVCPLTPTPSAEKAYVLNEKTKGWGSIVLTDTTIERVYSFPQYLADDGIKMDVTVGLDFTLTSRLYHKLENNHFQQALQEFGNVLQTFNTKKTFPLYAFGVRQKDEYGRIYGNTEQILPLHAILNNDNEEFFTVTKLVKGYETILQQNRLSYSFPRHFSPLLLQMIESLKKLQATSTQQQQEVYSVLLLITNGMNDDDELMKTAIIESSCLPISIIIVDISDPDDPVDGSKKDEIRKFERQYLSCTNPITKVTNHLSHGDHTAVRKNVLFFKYQELQRTKAQLSKEVYEKLSEQILTFMSQHQRIPKIYRHQG